MARWKLDVDNLPNPLRASQIRSTACVRSFCDATLGMLGAGAKVL